MESVDAMYRHHDNASDLSAFTLRLRLQLFCIVAISV